MKKVMVFGTFDGIHEGHLDFFRQAKQYGDFLTVIVARDKNVLKIKNHLPQRDENKRLADLKNVKIIDEVILGDEENPYKRIQEIKPDVICLGYDQMAFTDKLEERLKELSSQTKIFRAKPYKPEQFKSSLLNK